MNTDLERTEKQQRFGPRTAGAPTADSDANPLPPNNRRGAILYTRRKRLFRLLGLEWTPAQERTFQIALADSRRRKEWEQALRTAAERNDRDEGMRLVLEWLKVEVADAQEGDSSTPR